MLHTHTHTHTHTHIHTSSSTHSRMLLPTHTCIHTHIHSSPQNTLTHIHILTHTQTQVHIATHAHAIHRKLRETHSAYTLWRVTLPPPHTLMHIHLHTYTLSHVHNLTIHTYIWHSQWHTHTRMHAHTRAHTLIRRNTHICTCSHAQRQTCTITHTLTCVPADPDALTRAWTHVLNTVSVSSLRIHCTVPEGTCKPCTVNTTHVSLTGRFLLAGVSLTPPGYLPASGCFPC